MFSSNCFSHDIWFSVSLVVPITLFEISIILGYRKYFNKRVIVRVHGHLRQERIDRVGTRTGWPLDQPDKVRILGAGTIFPGDFSTYITFPLNFKRLSEFPDTNRTTPADFSLRSGIGSCIFTPYTSRRWFQSFYELGSRYLPIIECWEKTMRAVRSRQKCSEKIDLYLALVWEIWVSTWNSTRSHRKTHSRHPA